MDEIRHMQERDIEAAMRLVALAGWNQTDADWQFYLRASPDGCFVAVRDGRTVGTMTTVCYGERVSWISMLLVDPAFRRKGIGTRLMRRAMAHLAGRATVALDATPEGRPIYERLGFRATDGLLRMTVKRCPPVAVPAAGIVPVAARAFDALAARDRRAFGADRSALLLDLHRRAPELAWQRATGKTVRGYCLGRRGTTYAHVGPLVAETVDDAAALCVTALHGISGQAVVLDVPTCQARFLDWLRELGFAEQRSFTRMCLGEGHLPGMPEDQYAIAGPEYG